MGGGLFEDGCEFIYPRTLVLVGKTGNGKSATGNSIIGNQMFKSKRSSSVVTTTTELQAALLEDGQMFNVIDTPGLFDSSLDFEFIGNEIVKCMNMAKNGIHAFLVVVSIRTRFSKDEKEAISSLETLFGRKIYDYMTVVFTGGDDLDDDDETFEDFLCDSPEALKDVLNLCGNRYVLFDNKTKDQTKRSNQVLKLVSVVNEVSRKINGKPYTNEMFTELKIEMKLRESNLKLEQQLAEERAARVKTEKKAEAVQKKSDEEKLKMKEKVELKLKVSSLKLEQERAARVKAEKKAKVVQKKSDEEKLKLRVQIG